MTTWSSNLILILLSCLVLIDGLLAQAGVEKTVMLIEMTRHGARMPVYTAVKEDWTVGLKQGEITPVGIRMHYYLGKEMLKRYPEILGKRLDTNEYFVRSTDVQRTFVSAQAHLFGIFNLTSAKKLPFKNGDERILPPIVAEQKMGTEVNLSTPLPNNFEPVAIHTDLVVDDDVLFLLNSKKCPRGNREVKLLDTKILNDTAKDTMFKAMVASAAQKYGIDWKGNDPYRTCVDLGDFAIQDVVNNPNPKIPVTDPLFKRLSRCYEFNVAFRYLNPRLLGVTSSALIAEIVTKLRNFTETKEPVKEKYHYYSGHDSTLLPFLIMAKKVDLECMNQSLYESVPSDCGMFPTVASNIVFELNQIDKRYFVRVLSNFEPLDFCRLNNPLSDYRCPLETFEKVILKFIDPTWKDYCWEEENRPSDLPENIYNHKRLKASLHLWRSWALVLIALLILVILNIFYITAKLRELKRASESNPSLRVTTDKSKMQAASFGLHADERHSPLVERDT